MSDRIGEVTLASLVISNPARETWRGTTPDDRRVFVRRPRRAEHEGAFRAGYANAVEVIARSGFTKRLPDEVLRDIDPVHTISDDVEGAEPLADCIARDVFRDLDTFYRCAISLCTAVGELHETGFAHNALNTESVWCTSDGECLLSDFDEAGAFSSCSPRNLNRLVGNHDALAHLSPEQTGRTSRGVDYRSDLYALGVLFFRMLTGSYPLEADDTVGWVHAHVARAPTELHTVRPDLPPALSTIVARLLQKNGEDRSNNAFGIARDLEAVSQGRSSDVEDNSDSNAGFALSRRLYDRDEDIRVLQERFDRVAQGSFECVFVTGESGAGKTGLVQEAMKQAGGIGSSGKFEQFGRATPHAGFLQVLERLVAQLLEDPTPPATLLDPDVANRVVVLVDRVPGLQALLGARPNLSRPNDADALSRFHAGVIAFLGAIATAKRPLRIFLDDLQWSDPASLALVEELCSAEPSHVLLLCSYRDNEINPTHALIGIRSRLASIAMAVTVGPLSLDGLSGLIHDSFGMQPTATAELAQLVLKKTGGTPFYAREFLFSLYVEGALRYRFFEHRWVVDFDLANTHAETENVVKLMALRIAALDEKLQSALWHASLIGTQFDLRTLSDFCGQSANDTHDILLTAIQTGLLSGLGGTCLLEHGDDGPALIEERAAKLHYQFAHDRIQQAARTFVPNDEEPTHHFRLARLLQSQRADLNLSHSDFAIANHFNDAIACLEDPKDFLDVAQANLRAADLAQMSGASGTTRMYSENAVGALTRCDAERGLMLDAHRKLGLAAMLNGDGEAAEASYLVALDYCDSVLDRISVDVLRMEMNVAQGHISEALALLLGMLSSLGVELNADNVREEAAKASGMIREARAGRTVEQIMAAPPMQDPVDVALVALVGRAIDTAFMAGREWSIAVTSAGVARSLEKGSIVESGMAFSTYGCLDSESNGVDGFKRRYEYGVLGRQIADRSHDPRWISATNVSNNHFYGMPFSEARKRFDYASVVAEQSSNLTWLHYSYVRSLFLGLTMGSNLEELRQGALEARAKAVQAQRMVSVACHDCMLGFVDALVDGGPRPWLLGGDKKQELEQAVLMMGPWAACKFYATQQLLAVVWGRYDVVRKAMTGMTPFVHALNGMSHEPLHYLIEAMVVAAENEAGASERLGKLHQYFVDHAELNADYVPFELLVLTVKHKAADQPVEAMEACLRAAEEARDRGQTHLEALANETAASIADQRGRTHLRDFHLGQAANAYDRWGASSKARSLRGQVETRVDDRTAIETSRPVLQVEDADSLLKACRVISSEVRIDDLLQSLMRILTENLGAQYGLLLLEERGDLVARAETVPKDSGDIETRLIRNRMSREDPRWQFIDRVRQSKKEVIVDVNDPGGFDLESIPSRPQSVLCTPIITRGLLGVLYLENRSLAGVFSKRGDVLEFLLAQVGISLENSRLFESLTLENLERTSAERVLRLERDYSQEIIESSPLVVCIVDPSGVIRFANGDAARITGLDREQLLGSLWGKIFGAESAGILQETGTGGRGGGEASFVDSSGAIHTVAWSVVVHRDEQQTVFETVCFGIDLTDVRHAEQERTRYQAKLLESQRLETVGTLAAGVAHDFNNLLVPILACGSFLLKTEDPDVKELADDIMAAATRGAGLAEQLLGASRRSEPVMAPVLLQKTIREVLQLTRATAPANIELQVDVDDDCLPVLADADQVHQALLNLCTNAVHAERGVSRGILRVSLEMQDANNGQCPGGCSYPCAWIRVVDNGHGMDEETKKRIFDPFFTTKGVSEGTGLGLWGVHQIVTSHNGTISVSSDVGRGAEFSLCLPLAPVDAEVSEDSTAHQSLDGNERVLFVEDEDATARIIGRILNAHGYAVETYLSPLEALEAFSQDPNRFDVVITDFSMPQMPGTLLAKKIRQQRPTLPIIMVSGLATLIPEDEADQAQVTELLAKPLTGEDYAAAIRRALDLVKA